MTRQSIYSIDAGLPFARDLAAGVIQLAGSPERLARALILVPSRRSAIALQAAFLDISDGAAMLLPQMVPIGDFDEDGPYVSWEGGIARGADLPPPISPLRRQINLAKLLRHFPLGGQYPSHPQAMRLAEALAELLDQLYNANATAVQLKELLPERFSAHWQDIMLLLQILIDRWPDILKAEGVIDAVDRRNRILRRQAKAWHKNPPDQLVVLAGSTGSIAATKSLIAAVAGLPDGHVVLPGLDRSAADQWEAISGDSTHPQYQLAQLLVYLDIGLRDVQDWVSVSDDLPPALAARRHLMREVFRPAVLSASWQQLGAAEQLIDRTALDGLKVLTGRDRREEVTMIALSLREVLETPTKTAALVSPDRQLAELVTAELARWHIEIEDSAGQRLALTPVGRFLQLLADSVAANFAPLPLLSLLKHPFAAGGMARTAFRRQLDRIELSTLRGMRPEGGLDGLVAAIEDSELKQFVNRHVRANLCPAISAWRVPNATLASLAAGIAEAAEMLASTEMAADNMAGDRGSGAIILWEGAAGKVASDLLRNLATDGRDELVLAADMPQIFQQLLDRQTVRPHGKPHPRLAILGPFEARMHPTQVVGCHRIIIAGFNEGNWPPRPDVDLWMNSSMRKAVGLPPRNWRSGLSAHDFYMAVCSREIVVTRSAKDSGTPTIKSRWLQRLEVVLNALGLENTLDTGEREAAWLNHLAPEVRPNRAERPVPCPPLASRPRTFSATEIDIWLTDPYAIYAKKILRLKPLEPVDRPPNMSLRGTMFHEALAKFTKANPTGVLRPNALAQLLAIGRAEFGNQMDEAAIKMFWWPRFEAMARWFVETEKRRRENIASVYAEIRGSIALSAPQGPVTLSARADRLEYGFDGTWTIVDYKTGVVPSHNHVRAGVRNQLAVEALIAAEGGFSGLPPGPVAALEYWQISGKGSAPGDIKSGLDSAFDAASKRQYLENLAAEYDNPQRGYPSEPDPSLVPSFKPYEHLSRSREWRSGADYED